MPQIYNPHKISENLSTLMSLRLINSQPELGDILTNISVKKAKHTNPNLVEIGVFYPLEVGYN